MTFYAIRKDLPDYQVLDLDLMDVTRNLPDGVDLDSVYDFSQLNTAMISWWQTPETRYISTSSKKAQIPDISCWIDATLVLSPRAYRLLKDTLSNSGELLPVQVGEEHQQIARTDRVAQDQAAPLPQHQRCRQRDDHVHRTLQGRREPPSLDILFQTAFALVGKVVRERRFER